VRGLLVLLAVLVLSSPAAAGPRPATAKACGQITVRLGGNDFGYRVRVVSGSVRCDTARTVLRTFVAHATKPRGWFCTRGHGADAWAASCARLSPKALVRAYLIGG